MARYPVNNGKETKWKATTVKAYTEQNNGCIREGNIEKILRHKDALSTIIKLIEEFKQEVEQDKLEKEGSIEDVEIWDHEIKEKLYESDAELTHLKQWLDEAATKVEHEKRNKEDVLVAQQREEKLKFDKALMQQKMELEGTTQNTNKAEKKESVRVRLPELIITKFDGALKNWLPFWNKLKPEIDSSNMVAVTKFAYLKEMLEPKVKQGINGLPFITEGYERAKNILNTEYGKVSEIVNTYIDNIMALPVITGAQPAKIYEFYQTLTYNVQLLESLGKLTECWGLLWTVLNKLKGIADLGRGQANWQMWGFPELIQAF